jgi:small subunit ribosomal protein S5
MVASRRWRKPRAKADWSSKWLTKPKFRRPTQPLPMRRQPHHPPRAVARVADVVVAAVAAIIAVAVAEELIEKLVHINRVSKTVKGGKRFGFAALVVVGDGKGRVGFGHGKAREVPEAISKATAAAKKAMVRVPLKEGRTLHHDGNGHFGAGRVSLRSAPQGTGIIAGGPMRAIFESLGVADVVTKSVGTSNPYNMIRATFAALNEQTSPKSVAQRRGKKIADLLGRGGSQTAEADAAAMVE